MSVSVDLAPRLTDFAQDLGVALTWDDAGMASLVIDKHPITLVANFPVGHVTIYTVLGPVAGPARASVLRLMLQANCGWAATRGATLSLLGGSGDTVLAIRLPAVSLDATRLRTTLGDLCDTAETWQAVLASAEHDNNTQPPASVAIGTLA
ncbi:type III secretion system chaperone [Telmatospirillum sp. J64-1]|uniref:type III secretion system chaperone n=1 Tax=Telmatospirillum sp. J64-1 TaxID=2502183 RepID=UPI00115C7C1E|nr:type III secretion system chaperone [Telmatospirillum sp. J64-1]